MLLEKLSEREEADFFFRYNQLSEDGKLDVLRRMIEMALGACPVGAPQFPTLMKMIFLFENWSISRLQGVVANEEVRPPQASVE